MERVGTCGWDGVSLGHLWGVLGVSSFRWGEMGRVGLGAGGCGLGAGACRRRGEEGKGRSVNGRGVERGGKGPAGRH